MTTKDKYEKKIKLFLTYLLVNWFPTAALTRLSTLFFLTISMAPDSRLSLIPLENGTLGVKNQSTLNPQP